MADLDVKLAIDRLADYLASAPLSLARTGSAIAVFSHQFDEDFAADPYTVVRAYPGSAPYHPVPSIAVQCLTIGKIAAAAMGRAQALFNRLRDTKGRPVRDLSITGFVVKGVKNLQTPGSVGADERGREQIVFNFDYLPLAV